MELKTKKYKELLARFDRHVISTKSIKTGNHYTNQVKEFLCYLEDRGITSLKKVDATTTKTYFNYLTMRSKHKGEGTLSLRTVNDNLSTLRSFSIRIQQEGIIQKGIPIPKNFRTDNKSKNPFSLVRQILTQDEVKEVFEHAQSPKEKALIALAYGCGLRRSELVNLKESHIDFQKGQVLVMKSKNNKTRQVPISDFFLGVLKEYVTYRLRVLAKVNQRPSSFFVSDKGRPHNKGGHLNNMLKAIIRRTGNSAIIEKQITLHCLRHSIATHLMEAGESYEFVKTFLGHSLADTTLIYAKRRKQKNYYMI